MHFHETERHILKLETTGSTTATVQEGTGSTTATVQETTGSTTATEL